MIIIVTIRYSIFIFTNTQKVTQEPFANVFSLDESELFHLATFLHKNSFLKTYFCSIKKSTMLKFELRM